MNFTFSKSMPSIKEGHLFNDSAFHYLKSQEGYFYSIGNEEMTIARIAFYHNDLLAISGYQAPFGSMDYLSDCNIDKLTELLSLSVDDLRSRGVETVTVKQPPSFCQFASQSEAVLHRLGFREETAELNQHLLVDEKPFNKKITQKERNKLNRSESDGYIMRLIGREEISKAFKLIQATYGRKGFPITMLQEDLLLAYDTLPERYILFGLYDKHELIAVIASVIVTDDVLYNFYHADLESYRSRSPLVMLIGEVYDYCYQHNVSVLDLGISSVNGQVNDGLFRFKQNLGCLVSTKKTFSLDL